MKTILLIVQIISAITLVILVLMQSKGTGFSRSWKSSASFTRMGLEKAIFKFTFFISFLFIFISIFSLLV